MLIHAHTASKAVNTEQNAMRRARIFVFIKTRFREYCSVTISFQTSVNKTECKYTIFSNIILYPRRFVNQPLLTLHQRYVRIVHVKMQYLHYLLSSV